MHFAVNLYIDVITIIFKYCRSSEMFKRIIFFLCLIIIDFNADAQNKVDSLHTLLNGVDDSLKVEVLNELSKSLNHTDPKNSLKYAIEAKQLAIELNVMSLIGKSINYIGVSYYYLNELDLSNESYFEALNIFDSIGYQPGVAKALNNIAWNYKIQELPDEAIEYFNRALSIAVEIGDGDLHQGILNNLGTVYKTIKDYDKALDIYHQSLEMNIRTNNKQWEAYNLSNIGLIYMLTFENEKALNNFHRAREINEQYNYTKEYATNLLNIGGVYLNQSDFELAHQYFNEADSIIEVNGFKREKIDLYSYRLKYNKAIGNFEAALHFDSLYYSLSMELNKMAWNEKVSELYAKYDIAQKGRELEESKRKINQQKTVIVGGSALFLLLLSILLLVLNLYKSKNRWANNIGKLNAEIEQKNEALSLMNEEISSINEKLEQTIEERTERIKTQNGKLVNFAFMNSHEIRGPLARVLGLIYLLNKENKALRNDDSFIKLKNASEELDSVVSDASKLLEDEELGIENQNSAS